MSTDFVSLFTGMSERDIGYLLKSMVQRSINTELTNTDISNIDNKTPVLLTNSKDIELMNDIAIQSAINIEVPTLYIMTEEPDGNNLKVWLKFQNAGELRDWSYQKNKAYSVGTNTMPGLFYRTELNNMLKSELYSYFNGNDHFGYVVDAAPVRILPNITAGKTTAFFMRLFPISLAKLLYAENNSLFTKADDDQLRYGYSVTIDMEGNINFYIKNNYIQYHLFVKDAYNYLTTDPIVSVGTQGAYRLENFNITNFKTNYETLCNIVDEQRPFDDWFFKYDPTDHNMSVIKTVENNPSSILADTSLQISIPVLSCPIQEGKYTHSGTVQTTVYDNSGNGNNGTITNISIGAEWQDDNTLFSSGTNPDSTDGCEIDFPTITALNNATEYTVSFWYKSSNVLNEKAYSSWLVSKNYDNNGSWIIYRKPNTAAIAAQYKNNTGTSDEIVFNNAITESDKWHHIVARFKPSQPIQISINGSTSDGPILPDDVTAASGVVKMYSTGTAASGTIALLKIWDSSITDNHISDIFYEGYHNPLFPKSENIQPEPPGPEDEIFIPFSNIYTLDKMTTPVAADYRKINSLAGDNPLIQKYSVADGSSTTDPEVLKYDVPDGISSSGNPFVLQYNYTPTSSDNPFVLEYNYTPTSTDNPFVLQYSHTPSSGGTPSPPQQVYFLQEESSTGDLQDDQDSYGQRVHSTSSNLYNKSITSIQIWLKGANSPGGTVALGVIRSNGSFTQFGTSFSGSSLTSDWVSYTRTGSITTPLDVGDAVGIRWTGGSGDDEVHIRRGGSGNHYENSSWSSQSVRSTGGSWQNNTSFSMAGTILAGEGVPVASVALSNNTGDNVVAILFGSASPVVGKVITKAHFYLMGQNTPTGTVYCRVWDHNNNLVTTIDSKPANTINTGGFTEYVFGNGTASYGPMQTNWKIGIEYNGGSSNDDTIIVQASSVNAVANAQFYLRNSSTGWWFNNDKETGGKLYSGGGQGTSINLSGTSGISAGGIQILSGSPVIGKVITKAHFYLKGENSPTGTVYCRVWNSSGTLVATLASMSANLINAGGFTEYVFGDGTMTYATIQAGWRIGIEYSSGTSTHTVYVQVDAANTISTAQRARRTSAGSWSVNNGEETGGKLYSGTGIGTSINLSGTSGIRVGGIEILSGSPVIGKVITKAHFYLKAQNSPTGTVYCRIWDDSSNIITTLDSKTANTISTTGFTEYIFQNTAANYSVIQAGWHIGIEYSSGTSTHTVYVQADGINAISTAQRASRDSAGSWSVNSAEETGGKLYSGTGAGATDPWVELGSGGITTITESFGGTAHNMLNQIPRKIILRLKKTGTPSGSFSVVLMNSSGTVLQTLSGLTTANSLTTLFANYTFTDLTHTTSLTSGVQIAVNYGGTGGKVCVMTNSNNTTASNAINTGGTNNYHGSSSYVRTYQSGWLSPSTSLDLSMKVYVGGNTFDAYIRLSSSRTRVATKAVNNQSQLHNQKITKVVARIKKVGAPSGIITARIRDPNDVQRVLFSSVDVSTITANGIYNDVEFTNFMNTYLINQQTGSGDKVTYEFTGSNDTNYLEFNSNKDVFDTANLATITQTYDSANYIDYSQRDLAGKMYSGGEPDLNSRTRVAQSIEHQDSRLKGKKITRVKAFIYRTNTSTSGTVYCNIRRGIDDSLVKTLGTVGASSLSTTAGSPSQLIFQDITNNYPMTVGDKICIEFNGGSATNAVGVLVRTVTPNYDSSNSYIRKYDELDWDDEETTKDLCAVMDEGGFFFIPDAGFISDPTPVNDKDLIICAGNNKVSGFFETFLMEFRIYTKDITLNEADNLYNNRYSISPIAPGSILMPFSLRAVTLDPV